MIALAHPRPISSLIVDVEGSQWVFGAWVMIHVLYVGILEHPPRRATSSSNKAERSPPRVDWWIQHESPKDSIRQTR